MLLWAGCRACSNSGGAEADIFALKRSLDVRQVSELAGVDLTVVAFLGYLIGCAAFQATMAKKVAP